MFCQHVVGMQDGNKWGRAYFLVVDSSEGIRNVVSVTCPEMHMQSLASNPDVMSPILMPSPQDCLFSQGNSSLAVHLTGHVDTVSIFNR